MLKTILKASVITLGLMGAAQAADLGTRIVKPAPVAPLFTWTGFYVGANAGAAIGDSKASYDPSGSFLGAAFVPLNPLRTYRHSFDDVGFTGGVQAGYNWQTGALVIGAEADFNYGGGSKHDNVVQTLTAPLVGTWTHNISSELEWFGTVRARLGYAVMPNWLVYATGGLAYGSVKSSSFGVFSAAGDAYAGSKSRIKTGWTIGGGTEYAFDAHWSAKLEYLYVDLGSSSYINAATNFPGGFAYRTKIDERDHIVRAGINYKF